MVGSENWKGGGKPIQSIISQGEKEQLGGKIGDSRRGKRLTPPLYHSEGNRSLGIIIKKVRKLQKKSILLFTSDLGIGRIDFAGANGQRVWIRQRVLI